MNLSIHRNGWGVIEVFKSKSSSSWPIILANYPPSGMFIYQLLRSTTYRRGNLKFHTEDPKLRWSKSNTGMKRSTSRLRRRSFSCSRSWQKEGKKKKNLPASDLTRWMRAATKEGWETKSYRARDDVRKSKKGKASLPPTLIAASGEA